MARSGELVGASRSRAVWRFGFLPGSDAANAYGVSTEEFLWALADRHGKILSTFLGFAVQLPNRFKRIISCRAAKRARIADRR
jgi:hypothetical protein